MNFYQKIEHRLVGALGLDASERLSIKARLLIRFTLAYLATRLLLLFLATRTDVLWFKLIQLLPIASVIAVIAILWAKGRFRFAVGVFIGTNLLILTASLIIMGGDIQTINNAWFPLFLILAYLLLGKRAGLITIVYYALVITVTFVLHRQGYLNYDPEPLGRIEHELLTATSVILFSFLVYILLNGLTEIKEESERRLALTLSQEKKHVEVMLRNQRDLLQTIDELEKTQNELKQATEQLEQSQVIARQGNYEINLITGETQWSKMTPVLFHYPPGTQWRDVDFDSMISAEDRKVINQYREDIQSHKRPVQFTFKATNPRNGRVSYIEVRNFPVEDDDGNVICIRGALRDCTIETLYNQSLVTQKEAAEAATQAKASFLSTMSHEIRTPMNAVIGLAQLLLMENPRPDQLENLRTLHQAANHLLGLLNDILDFSKIEANKLELEQAPVQVNTLLDEVKRLFTIKAQNRGLSLEIQSKVPPGLTVVGDPLRIKQILTNLVSNALKFTKTGGAIIKAHLSGPEGNQVLSISVKDTGIGIREQDQAAIFESFSQASREITRQFGGTGLGLSIVKGLVESMGGKIWLESRLGEGSEFFLTLPLPILKNEHLDYQPENTEHIGSVDLSRLRVLVVEDNPVNVMVARKALHSMGITQIEVAENGLLAVDTARKTRFDLILMDLQMPVMDGLTATVNIRKNEAPDLPPVPIIALTASASAEVRQKITTVGINGFATKPFVIRELERVIREHTSSEAIARVGS